MNRIYFSKFGDILIKGGEKKISESQQKKIIKVSIYIQAVIGMYIISFIHKVVREIPGSQTLGQERSKMGSFTVKKNLVKYGQYLIQLTI